METKQNVKRKYIKRDETQGKMSKCGHFSPTARYFKCEKCLPELLDDNGDWDYFNLDDSE